MDVACGAMHTVVILEDGTIWTSGVNDDGALGRETAEETSNGGAVPTDKDPTVFGRVHLPGGAARPVQSVATDSASFVLTEDGCVFGWGTFRNERGIFRFSPTANRQLTPALVYKPRGNDAPPVVKLAAGSNHVVAILKVNFRLWIYSGLMVVVVRMAGRCLGEMVIRDSWEGSL